LIRTVIGRPARLLLVPLLATALLTACRGGEREHSAQGSAGGGTPRRGGQAVIAWSVEPAGVNEYITPSAQPTTELLNCIFGHLVQEQPDFAEHPPSFAPDLAKSYDWSADHKDLTFHLREDAVWSDGVPLTADDVRWTWQVQKDPAVAWDFEFMKREIRDVEVVDPHAVRFHFTRAYAKQMTDVNEGVILPKHAWSSLPFAKWRQSADWFKQHGVYSGPFVIASWSRQQEIVLQRNERYYRKDRPYLDRLVNRITPDPGSLLVQLLNGEADFTSQVSPRDAPRIKADPKLALVAYWSNLYVFIAWNNQDPLFADRDVRRALTLAIDRQALVDTILGPYGRVAASPIISSIWAHDRTLKPLPYDPAEARRILESKGWKDSDGDGVLDRNGKPFAFELPTNAGNQQRADAAVMIQEQLKKVGIKATPRLMEFNTLVAQSNAGKIPAMILGLSLDTSLDLTGNFHSRSIPGPGREGSNFERYANPEIDRLIDQAAAETDFLKARPALDQIQRILYRDQSVTLLWESQRLTPINKRIHDAKPNVIRSLFNVKDWWVDPQG
jgi:peptide/nickel transport system substrate-binding protein